MLPFKVSSVSVTRNDSASPMWIQQKAGKMLSHFHMENVASQFLSVSKCTVSEAKVNSQTHLLQSDRMPTSHQQPRTLCILDVDACVCVCALCVYMHVKGVGRIHSLFFGFNRQASLFAPLNRKCCAICDSSIYSGQWSMTKSKALVQTGPPSCLLSTWMTAPLSPQGMAAFLLICYVTTAGQHVALHTPVSILLKVEATEARLPWKWQKGFMDLIRFYNTHNRTGNLTLTLHREIATYCSVM